jgi:hypothetical protein
MTASSDISAPPLSRTRQGIACVGAFHASIAECQVRQRMSMLGYHAFVLRLAQGRII